jgi:hypothetical protein
MRISINRESSFKLLKIRLSAMAATLSTDSHRLLLVEVESSKAAGMRIDIPKMEVVASLERSPAA